MPDDITPEPPDDAPTGATPGDPGGHESWDTATQANPAATPAGDLTQSIPADTTRSTMPAGSGAGRNGTAGRR